MHLWSFHFSGMLNFFFLHLNVLEYRLRVVPLFETVKDLRGAGSVIRKLLSIDWYRDHVIKNHNGHQEVFLTFRIKALFDKPHIYQRRFFSFNEVHIYRLWLGTLILVKMLGASPLRGNSTKPKRMLWQHAMNMALKLLSSMVVEGVLVVGVAPHILPFNRSLLVLLW